MWMAVACSAVQATEARVGLVIGNGTYKVGPLKNPVNDARGMSKALGRLGFDVILVENATRATMYQQLRNFRSKLTSEAVGLIFFAGHGIQVNGKNYLIPIDAAFDTESEVDEQSMGLDNILIRLDEARNRLNIVILDACRDNPFERSFRSSSRGLAQVDAPRGTLIAFATSPGRTASDGTGSNGLYTGALLQTIELPVSWPRFLWTPICPN
jgi:uncharacterized caspase-like protein